MDDGNRQLSISASLALSPEQFEALDLKLGDIHGAVDKLAENIAEPDTSVAAEIVSLKQEISVGFAGVQQSLANLENTIFDASNNIGKWLAAIALAASTPDDNSKQVQEQIDSLTRQLKSSTDELDATVKANQPK